MYLNKLTELNIEDLVNNVDLKYIFRCILKLTATDTLIFRVLIENNGNPLTVSEIATIIKKSRSTVEKSLLKLIHLGLVSRRIVLARRGGYTYVYTAASIDHIKERLRDLTQGYYLRSMELLNSANPVDIVKSIEESSLNGE